MAVAVRATFIGSSTTTTTSWAPTVTGGTGTASGDRAVVVFTSRGHTSGDTPASITDNSGDGVAWTNVHTSDNRKYYVWTKVLNSSHDSDTVTVSGAIDSCAGVLAYVSGAGALQDLFEESHASGTESHSGFTPTSADSMVFGSVFNGVNDDAVTAESWATLGAATGTRQHLSTGGNDSATSLAWKLQTGGPTGTGTFTWSQPNNATRSVLFSIAPVANVTVTPTTAALVLTTFAPTVTTTGNVTATPTTAALVLTTFAPIVTAGTNVTVTPTTATLNLSSFAPTVTATGAGYAHTFVVIVG